jgi:hypothetical protein
MDLEYARNLLVDKRVGLESLQEQMRVYRELGESQQE